jgi:glycerol-3-phosphate O-acyltransferase/dihydroxyacetone phosphate acyltransferase
VTARDLADRATGWLARTMIGIFFRSLEVAGNDHVPLGGPVIEVANHQNGLVDAVVLMAAGQRLPHFLGKSTLWKIVPLRPLLALAGVVPVYRGADVAGHLSDGQRAEHNRTALARSRDVLRAGGVIGVFPEGVSHDLASLQDLRPGAARLALEAAEDGVAGVVVLPVGIVYDDKARFRSRVLVRFGAPRTVDGRIGAYRADPRAAVADLTAAIGADLRAVGPDFDSIEQAERLARIAALVADPASQAEAGLAEQDRIARALATAATDPTRRPAVERIERLGRRYETALGHAGLATGDLRSDALRPGGRRPDSLRPAPRLRLVAVPVTAIGVAVHAVPFAIIKVLGDLPRNRGMRSTVKLFGSFGLYNLTYVVLATVTGRRRGPVAAVVALVGAPLSGWVALRTLETADEAGLAQRAGAIVARRRSTVARLETERQRLAAAVRTVVPAAPVD